MHRSMAPTHMRMRPASMMQRKKGLALRSTLSFLNATTIPIRAIDSMIHRPPRDNTTSRRGSATVYGVTQ